ncbi:MAG TPA: ATP-binding cassette domain-containing protein, partial [Lacipirellulaceae bacterium]|nr:ATP-binding cassette domain-containing protein [Lacipirellulaceae bacterium]
GELVMFLYYAQLFFAPVQDMSAWFAELQMAQASAERVLGLIEAVPDVRDSEQVIRNSNKTVGDCPDSSESARKNGTVPLSETHRIGRIQFEQVGFRYRSGPQVIAGLDLTVEPGETIALVGETGGGKSTIVNLLCRFYEPTEGRILLDGLDYRERSLDRLQSNLGIVLQQPHLFSGSIEENIRYGKLDATPQEIRAAAQLACADEFISALEKRYDTQVGEGGNQLSIGQKQLISIARAILKQPQLLILDEATSSVDTETERQIQAGLAHLLFGRTSFVIAHRLSTIRAADRILVVDHGQIIERGTHMDLMRLRGAYYALYIAQANRDFVLTA